MKKRIKLKILAGFMLLIALLMVAGAVSVVEFVKLSSSVNALIEDNYKTIEASKKLLESLERKDSGVLLMLLGERDEGRMIIDSANANFEVAYGIVKNNITETNEEDYIAKIDSLSATFNANVSEVLNNNIAIGDMVWYQRELYQSFSKVKHAVDDLMMLNQSSMYEEATMLKNKSHRAVMPGIIAIVGALVFSLILSFFISKYFVAPLSNLAEAIRSFHPREKYLKSCIKSEDEIKRIEDEVNALIIRLKKHLEIADRK
jgi:methyl-accepting chemotaxis protein